MPTMFIDIECIRILETPVYQIYIQHVPVLQYHADTGMLCFLDIETAKTLLIQKDVLNKVLEILDEQYTESKKFKSN